MLNLKLIALRLPLILALTSCASLAPRDSLCPQITFDGTPPSFSRNEILLLCGREGATGWEAVPLPQAKFHLEPMLQGRGYLNPNLEIQEDLLKIQLGPKTPATKVVLEDPTDLIDISKRRHLIGQDIKPSLLTEVENWVESVLKNQGYPCPTVKSTAYADSGEIDVNISAQGPLTVLKINRPPESPIAHEAIERYEAIQTGDIFDSRKLHLSSQRLIQSGLVQSAYMSWECLEQGSTVEHHLTWGPPQILRFGVGATTEEFPFLELSWKNSRLDRWGSNLTLTSYASRLLQSIRLTGEYYTPRLDHRVFLSPALELRRRDEPTFENQSLQTSIDIGRHWEVPTGRWTGKLGPSYTYLLTKRGAGPDDLGYVTYHAQIQYRSHDYEFNEAQQTSGLLVNAHFKTQRAGLGSPISVEQLVVSGKGLWNLGLYSPPKWVLAVRTHLASTLSSSLGKNEDRLELPQDYRNFLGGSRNLRGFSYQSISNQDLGYISTYYLGSELRLVKTVAFNLEPLALLDVAKTATESLSADQPTYYSIGVGVRWPSPIGPFRVTLARGMVTQRELPPNDIQDSEQIYLQYGVEF